MSHFKRKCGVLTCFRSKTRIFFLFDMITTFSFLFITYLTRENEPARLLLPFNSLHLGSTNVLSTHHMSSSQESQSYLSYTLSFTHIHELYWIMIFLPFISLIPSSHFLFYLFQYLKLRQSSQVEKYLHNLEDLKKQRKGIRGKSYNSQAKIKIKLVRYARRVIKIILNASLQQYDHILVRYRKNYTPLKN